LDIYLREDFEEFAVTNRRIITKHGIIRRDVAFLPLERIETVNVRQSLLGRFLNYGTVVVHTATTHGTTAWDCINDPEEWQTQVFRAIEGVQSSLSRGLWEPSSEVQGISKNISDRLRELESIFQRGLSVGG